MLQKGIFAEGRIVGTVVFDGEAAGLERGGRSFLQRHPTQIRPEERCHNRVAAAGGIHHSGRKARKHDPLLPRSGEDAVRAEGEKHALHALTEQSVHDALRRGLAREVLSLGEIRLESMESP